MSKGQFAGFAPLLIIAMAIAVACGGGNNKSSGKGAAGGTGAGAPISSASKVLPKDMENPRYGGTIRVMTNQATPSLDPVAVSTGGTSFALSLVYEKLFAYEGHDNDIGGDLVGVLATKYDASPDFKTFTIHLRQGVKWQNIPPVNGREFEAKDVVFVYQQYMQPTSVLAGQFGQIASVEAKDKYTVVVTLKAPNSGFINEVNVRSERIFPYDLPDRRTAAIGTGPYQVTSFVPGATVGSGLKATRNPTYWRKDAKGRQLPYVDNYEYIANPETAQKIAQIRTGSVNMVDNISYGDVQTVLRTNPELVAIAGPAVTYGGFSIVFRAENAPWSDSNIRCAINKAIDKKKLAQIVTGSDGALAGPFPWEWIHPERAITEADLGPCYTYDPAGAKKLLADAGYGPNKPLTATRTYGDAGDATTSENATIQQMLDEVGVKMTINKIDYGTYASGVYKRDYPDFGAGFPTIGGLLTPVVSLRGKFSSTGQFNFSFKAVKEKTTVYDQKILDFSATTDQKAQTAILQYFWDEFTNNSMEVMLRSAPASVIYTPNVKNVYARIGITNPFSSDCDSCRFVWLSDAPRTAP